MAGFKDLTPEQQEKAKAAKTADEIAEIAREEGTDLVDEELRVSGGNGSSLLRRGHVLPARRAVLPTRSVLQRPRVGIFQDVLM